MFQQMKKRIKNEKGLTLIELLAVVVILGIISAIAVPAIGNIIENSRSKAVVADAQNVMSAANLYFTEKSSANGAIVDITALKTAGYLESEGKLMSATVTKVAGGNTITFKAPVKGTDTQFGTFTLKNLADATFDAGSITINGTKYGE